MISIFLYRNIFALPYTSQDLAHKLLIEWLHVPLLYIIHYFKQHPYLPNI